MTPAGPAPSDRQDTAPSLGSACAPERAKGSGQEAQSVQSFRQKAQIKENEQDIFQLLGYLRFLHPISAIFHRDVGCCAPTHIQSGKCESRSFLTPTSEVVSSFAKKTKKSAGVIPQGERLSSLSDRIKPEFHQFKDKESLLCGWASSSWAGIAQSGIVGPV